MCLEPQEEAVLEQLTNSLDRIKDDIVIMNRVKNRLHPSKDHTHLFINKKTKRKKKELQSLMMLLLQNQDRNNYLRL